jgi:anti-sigma regulatory factor (Ser/Thr protein kinase)
VISPHVRHDLFVYDADDTFAAQVLRYVVAGLDAGEAVRVIVSPHKAAILREALGTDAQLVSFADPLEVYTRPEFALAQSDAACSANESGAGIRIYGELPVCETPQAWDRWMAYEALVNRAFENRGVTFMCGYDARVVPRAVLRQARQTHRVVLEDSWQVSPDFEEPETVLRRLTPPFEPLPGLRSLELGSSRELHDRLAEELAAASLHESRARDLLVAAGEVLCNAGRYGGGVQDVRVGRVGEHVVCEVTDGGGGFDDPLAGFLPPRPLAENQAGLWIARQLTARLEMRSEPYGLTVRLWA